MSFAANESDVMNDPRIRPAQLLHVGSYMVRECIQVLTIFMTVM